MKIRTPAVWMKIAVTSGLTALVGCSTATNGTTGTSASTDSSSTSLSAAVASSTDAAGTLLCEPAQAQIDACSGKAANDVCTLPAPDGGVGRSGVCRATIDGVSVACAPTPPAPPQALVDACTGKAAGDACQAMEAFGDVHQGECMTARDSTTLVCGRPQTPPQAAIDACASLAVGASCTLPVRDRFPDGGAETPIGTCSLGPASTGPLACAPSRDLLPNAAAACTGLSEGASCTLGDSHQSTKGTCVTPVTGGDLVCFAACADIGGLFHCGPGPRGGGPGEEHGGPPPFGGRR